MKIMVLLHKCAKRIVALPLLYFSLIFIFLFFYLGLLFFMASFLSLYLFGFLWPLFFLFIYLGFFGLFYLFIFVRCLIPTCGGIIVSIILSSLGQCSNNDDHHTSIYLQLNVYNSILEQNMTLYECLRRCTGMGNESRVTCMKIMHGGFATNTMSTT